MQTTPERRDPGSPATGSARYCGNCGIGLDGSPAYCPRCGFPQDTAVSSSSPVYAGFWVRVGASLIDAAVVLLPMSAFWNLIGASGSALAGVVGLIVWWVYNAATESSARQATVGKVAVHLVVTDAAGQRLSFGRATVRHFAKYVCWATYGVGFLMVAFTDRHRGLHDMIARTLVERGTRAGTA